MTETVFTIRAAALYRIIGNADAVVSKDGKKGAFLKQILDEFNIESSATLDALGTMAIHMNHEGARAQFPIDDVETLGKMIVYMIDYYRSHPELAPHIATMCGINEIDLGPEHNFQLMAATRNSRLLETATLNYEFYKLSKEIDVNVRTEFIKKDTNFHPESQFLCVIVTV